MVAMETIVGNKIESIEFGEVQQFDNMTVVPLFSDVEDGPTYLTMGEAMEKGVLTIKEVSTAGSVPELAVVNSFDIPVLLLDGEEVSGAKQNRIANTTILLKEHSETVIPVSCTENGRWHSVSDQFADSGALLSHDIRKKKVSSVHRSLLRSESYQSDQDEIWEGVEEMSVAARVNSPTSSMRDAFQERGNDLSKYLEAFTCLPNQKGILVFINGNLMGFDFLSFRTAYEKLHTKLVKSYAMDALISQRAEKKPVDLESAKPFLKQATTAVEKVYDSIGHGRDHRYEGKALVGSALVYGDSVIHMAFFKNESSEDVGNISSSSRRRAHRTD